MPRATKDTKKDEKIEEKKVAKSKASEKKETSKTTKKSEKDLKKKNVTTKSSTDAKKTSVGKKASSTSAKKAPSKKVVKEKTKATAKTSTKKEADKNETKTKKSTSISKKETKTSKSTGSKKVVKEAKTPEVKKVSNTTKKVTEKKASTKATSPTKKRATASKSKKLESNIVAEYYDLPYRYNETIVKILYQTPQVLFVYWDISDDDRNDFVNKYGEDFFNNTKPVLKIFNLTNNYNFEIDINDFANSWYINVNDANCDYKVELGRRPIFYDNGINTDYIYVSSSNNIQFPNDHILLEELPNIVNFKNVKTNKITTKNISTLRLVGINKIYSVYDFYKKLYNDDILEEINNKKILCSSSSTSSWSN